MNVDTPALLIDRQKMLNNIEKMQTLADSAGVKLRPHTKTHKIPEIALLQQKEGATGIAVAKISEAEVMCEAGIDDIQIANIIVGEDKISRLLFLHSKLQKLSCNVDSLEAAKTLSDIFESEGKWLDVYIEINSGHNRSGLKHYNEIYNLSKFIQDSPGLNLIGLFTHAGHAYSAESREQISEIGVYEGEFLREIALRLMNERILIPNISIGSTPTAEFCSKVEGVTEIRPGNYVFYDMIQVSLDSCTINECALTVKATVISKPDKGRVIIDAGAKALSIDKGVSAEMSPQGHGYVIGKNCIIERVSEEHGIITHEGEQFTIGEKLSIIPNHACVVMNLFDSAYLVDGNKIVDKLIIKGRGKSQ